MRTLLVQSLCFSDPSAVSKSLHADHQSVISAHVLHELETTPVPEWMSDPYLAPYLYDMDYEILDGHTSVGPQSHLLDPELRMTGGPGPPLILHTCCTLLQLCDSLEAWASCCHYRGVTNTSARSQRRC
jgi:hypothetical protein